MRTLLLLAISILITSGMSSCGSQAIAVWAGKLYIYVGNDLAFERKQDNEIIKYSDPKLVSNPMFCMNATDFESFLKTYVVSPKLKSPKDP